MMKNGRFNLRIIVISIVFFSIGVVLHSASTVRVAFVRLEGEGVPNQLERAINEVIISFTNEIKGYVIDDFGQSSEENIRMAGNLEYILTGRVLALDQGIKLELTLKNKQKQIVRSISKDYEGSNKILLDLRLLLKELFESRDLPSVDESIKVELNGSSDKSQLDVNLFQTLTLLQEHGTGKTGKLKK